MSREDSVIAVIAKACAEELAAGRSIYGRHPHLPGLMVEHAPDGCWFVVTLRPDGEIMRIERKEEIDPPSDRAA
jgi:hypothetical protein